MMQFVSAESATAAPEPIYYNRDGGGSGGSGSSSGGIYLDLITASSRESPSNTKMGNTGFQRSRPWPELPTNSAKSGMGRFNNAACMEQLLVHCAHAIESNDATLAQQILWVLNNIAPPDGDSNQRLTAAFLRALILRASRSGSAIASTIAAACATNGNNPFSHCVCYPLRVSPVALANFVDLTPWHRFGFSAANSAITNAAVGFSVLHLVDLTSTHGMQMPTLIEALAARPEGPPFLRLTVPAASSSTLSPPLALDISLDELGSRLVNFARSRNVGMEFRVVPSSPGDGFESLMEHLRFAQQLGGGGEDEALIINCHMVGHQIPEESVATGTSRRSFFLKEIRSLDPNLVVIVDEEADFTAGDVVGRLRAAFNYLWIPFDAVETFLPAGSEQRNNYETALCWKIENVIAMEGLQRVERLEPRNRWIQRMRAAGFHATGFAEEAAAEVKSMLDDHSAGWGLKKDEDELVLTWKGHDVLFSSAWVPSC